MSRYNFSTLPIVVIELTPQKISESKLWTYTNWRTYQSKYTEGEQEEEDEREKKLNCVLI